MDDNENITLVSDTVFKYLFKNEEIKHMYVNVIKHYTNIDLSNYELIDNELNTGTNQIKDYRLDIILKKDNHTVIIEMESNTTKTTDIKDYQYLYRVAGNIFGTGEKYSSKKVSLIKFNNYSSSTNYIKDKLLNYNFEDKKHNLIKEDIESFELILPYFHEIDYNELDEIDKFLWLFTCKNLDEMKEQDLIKEHQLLVNELERLSMDETFLYAYDHEKVQKKLCNSLYEEGIEKGIEQGIEQKTKETAVNLYKNGVSKEIIMKSLQIDEETLNNYINN